MNFVEISQHPLENPMPTLARIEHQNPVPVQWRSAGPPFHLLLLGFLAGLFAGQSAPASLMIWASGLTIAGICLSFTCFKLSQILKIQAERKTSAQTAWELERRLERLIPKRHMRAHGGHSHRPHERDESETDWMPVARRSRTIGNPR